MKRHSYKDSAASSTATHHPGSRQAVALEKHRALTFGTKLAAFVQLTKPKIMLLVVITGATSVFLEGSLLASPVRFLFVLLGLYLTGGAANAFNQYFERDLDSLMARTSGRRPLPLGLVSPGEALVFSISTALAGLALFAVVFNLLSAALALATIVFYSLFYTLLLKPTTTQNIVIGGAAGAMGPVIAWAAASGSVSWTAGVLFLIVFLWTPPHFWALALFCSDDYERTGLPMLPLVKGYEATVRGILLYSIATGLAALLLAGFGANWLYIGAALLLGGEFVRKALRLRAEPERKQERELFAYSIVYLFLIFSLAVVDHMVL
jgi:protoheme IX farnesyltransferase